MQNYSIKLLTPEKTELFMNMTYGRYKPFLSWMETVKGKIFPVGLFCDGKAAGLALGAHFRSESATELSLLSVFVEQEHRLKGHASQMINHLHHLAVNDGLKCIRAFYLSHRPNVTAIEKLLAKCGYSKPKPETFICVCDKKLTELPLLEYTKLPDGYETFQWMSLDFQSRTQLYNRWKDAEWFDPSLSPFDSEDTIVPEISLGLRHGDKIIGWSICHRIDASSIQYTSLFVMPEERNSAVGVALQMRSMRAHMLTELVEKIPYGIFMVRYDNRARLNVAKRKFAPYSLECYDQMLSRKQLA